MASKSDCTGWVDAMTGIIHRQEDVVRKFKGQLKTPLANEALRRMEHSYFVCVETKRHMEITLAVLDEYWSHC